MNSPELLYEMTAEQIHDVAFTETERKLTTNR